MGYHVLHVDAEAVVQGAVLDLSHLEFPMHVRGDFEKGTFKAFDERSDYPREVRVFHDLCFLVIFPDYLKDFRVGLSVHVLGRTKYLCL